MTTATVQFDELNHIYQKDGVVVPSVTQVLTLAGLSDFSTVPPHILEKARQVGTAVHEASQFLDEGDLDLESLDPSIVGYMVGYQKFREEHGFKATLIEHRTVGEHEGMAYGMCFDRLGSMNGYDCEVLLDIKTSSRPSASWAIQTAAYVDGWHNDPFRLIVHVAKDGSYKLIRHEDGEDFEVWRSALRVAYWRLNHGARLK